MGSCLCCRKNKLIGDYDDVVITKNLESTPYRWAVIKPRPSLSRLPHRQQQHQIKLLSLHDKPFEEIPEQQVCTTNPLCATLLPKSHSMTCLDVLEAYSRKSDELDPSLNFIEPKWVSSWDEAGGISSHTRGLPAPISTQERVYENEPKCLQDQQSYSTFFDILKSESTTAEVGLSDQSSLFGSPQKPLHQEKVVHRAIMPEPKTRIFSRRFGKYSVSKRLSNKYWASERETLLQRSSVQQCQSF